jgi:hypothetical protein
MWENVRAGIFGAEDLAFNVPFLVLSRSMLIYSYCLFHAGAFNVQRWTVGCERLELQSLIFLDQAGPIFLEAGCHNEGTLHCETA